MDDMTRKILSMPSVRRSLELVGLTAVLWNEVELIWYLIYTGMLHETPRNKVDKIYQFFMTGAAKRKFAISLAELAFTEKQCEWLIYLANKTDELAGRRNAVVHGDYRFDMLNGPPGLRISPSGGHNRKPNRFAKESKDLIPVIQRLTEQIDEHIAELDEFRGYMIQNVPGGQGVMKRPSSMPEEIWNALPREMREVIPLRTFPKKGGKHNLRPKR
jgi:hypothetical protein